MTAHEILLQHKFFKHKTHGCNCGPNGKAESYLNTPGKTEVRLYPKSRKFKIIENGKTPVSGRYIELNLSLMKFLRQ